MARKLKIAQFNTIQKVRKLTAINLHLIILHPYGPFILTSLQESPMDKYIEFDTDSKKTENFGNFPLDEKMANMV